MLLVSGSNKFPCASVGGVPETEYRQLILLTLLPPSSGSAGVSHNKSPATLQLVPLTNSSVRLPFCGPCVCIRFR